MSIRDCTIPGVLENMSRIHLLRLDGLNRGPLAASSQLKINVVH